MTLNRCELDDCTDRTVACLGCWMYLAPEHMATKYRCTTCNATLAHCSLQGRVLTVRPST